MKKQDTCIRCPLMDGRMIDSIVWFDIHGAVDFHDLDRVAPEKIFCQLLQQEVTDEGKIQPSELETNCFKQYNWLSKGQSELSCAKVFPHRQYSGIHRCSRLIFHHPLVLAISPPFPTFHPPLTQRLKRQRGCNKLPDLIE